MTHDPVERLLRIADEAPGALGEELGGWLSIVIRARLRGEVKTLDHGMGLIAWGGVHFEARQVMETQRMAIRTAQSIAADGDAIEVWKGMNCIFAGEANVNLFSH